MIQFGFNGRQRYLFSEEVVFAKKHGFDFLQLYTDSQSNFESLVSRENEIQEIGFPIVVHAVLDVAEIAKYAEKLEEPLIFLGLNELIIHPVNQSSLVDGLQIMINGLTKAFGVLKNKTIYLENNSMLNPIFHDPEELKEVFGKLPNLEFLLDVAHIDNYDHLGEMLKVKMPKILHVADRHLEVVHEHLPIGEGNIDFRRVFKGYLPNFDGRIIFEVSDNLAESKQKIQEIIAVGPKY